MRTTFLMTFALFLLLSTSRAEEVSPQNPALQPLYQQLRTLFRRYYPQATGHLLGDTIHFEHDTRIFLIHEPLKTREWQDPWEQRGPNKKGILCEMKLQHGVYAGAAAVPQSFDKRYFTILLLAPYSQKLDAHLHAQLFYPREVPEGFLKAYQETIQSFSP